MRTLLSYLCGERDHLPTIANIVIITILVLWGTGVGLIFAGWIHEFINGTSNTADLVRMFTEIFRLFGT